jgi:phosphoglycolate phosphatase
LRYKLVIFDFDGTLADSGAWLIELMNELAPRFGFKAVKPEEHDKIRGLSSAQFLEYIQAPAWKIPKIIAAVRQRAKQDAHLLQLFPGIHQIFADLKAGGARLSIVSSNSEEAIRIALGKSAALIDSYSCGASLFGKAIKLRKAVRLAGLKPSDAIYIGDELRDVTAARKAGVAMGAVSWGYNRRDALAAENPDHIFDTVPDIAGKLR